MRCLRTPYRRTFFGEGRRGVQPRLLCILCQGVWGVGCLRLLMEWVEWMWRVVVSSAATEARPSGTCQTGSGRSRLELGVNNTVSSSVRFAWHFAGLKLAGHRPARSFFLSFFLEFRRPSLMMMMIAVITIKSSLVPLIEGLCAQIYFRFEISVHTYIYLHTYVYACICTRKHMRMHDTVHTLKH